PAGARRRADARGAAARGRTIGAVMEQTRTKRILLVCTGNICRSPLAAALLDRALAQRGIDGIEVGSAGTGAWDGAPVSEGAYLEALLDTAVERIVKEFASGGNQR